MPLDAELHVFDDSAPAGGCLLVAGGMNLRPRPAAETSRQALGNFELGTRCANGDRLVNFATDNRLMVTNTRFQHPRRYLVTWYSNDQRTRNQIDYVLVRARWASSVLDCRAYRGVDTDSANNSDYSSILQDQDL